MNDKNTSLIIANLFIVSAFIVNNVIEWAIMLFFSLFWIFIYFIQVKEERELLRRKKQSEIFLDLLNRIKKESKVKTKGRKK